VQAQCLSAFRTLTPSNQKFPIQKKSCIPFQECSPSIEWNDEKTCSSFKPLIINGLGKPVKKNAIFRKEMRLAGFRANLGA
jgi:hypothetical protein